MPKKCLRCGSTFGSEAEYCPHDGSFLSKGDESSDPLLGTVLLEQFRIDACIGAGGMGTVYRAHQTTVGRDVAIKVLRPELAADEQAVVRFAREARLATSLDHPNLVRVFLSGRLPDGHLYIVMELLEGRSLAEELAANGPPSLERAVLMIMKLCAGLGAVHEAGVVHRDIKPENVFLVERGSDPDFVKLVDFGIARMLDGLGPTTQAGKVFGTATYISPESASGELADPRSDIYSLGVLSYQLLTGELPFEGESVAAVLMQHVHQPPPHLSTKGRGAEVPPDVAEVVMQALEKERDARQQSLAEFLDALAEAAGNAGLLNDARKLLLGTVWGDELTAPGSYLAELLASSAPPSVPPPADDIPRIAVERDPEEEALLSSAPKPFGTTSFDLAPEPRRKKQASLRRSVSLAVALFAVFGLAGGAALFALPAPTDVDVDLEQAPEPEPERESEPLAVETVPTLLAVESEPLPVFGPDAPIEDAPTPPATVEAPEPVPTEPKQKAKPKAKRRRPKPKALPKKAPAPVVLEPDEGIDWSLPDFPEATGNPNAPSGAPVVIDEPPSRE
jgi:serine/threonine-protein kinase